MNTDLDTSHDLSTAPLVTREAYEMAGYAGTANQYGVMGRLMSIHSKSSLDIPEDPRLYLNTNAPFSAVVCGVQGAGKSHTVSVILENMLVAGCPSIGSLEKPLSGLVLYLGEGGPSTLPSEVAWLAASSSAGITPPAIHVFVSQSSLNTMRAVYEPLGSHVVVEPLTFSESELDAQAFLSMMAVGSSDSAPLYVQVILTILRELGENYTYQAFMQALDVQKKSFNPAQISGLEQRMSLLTSFMDKKNHVSKGRAKGRACQPSRFAAGRLTIIDLSDPFIDPVSACGLFEIITRLFVRADVGTGKVLVVDEAHKYLSSTRGSSGLTNALLALTRQQRHLSMRVIISTQEPTVIPPVFLDLCTVVILHRFSSPSWWEHLIKHVSADFTGSDAFDKVVKLQTGQAIVLASSALGVFASTTSSEGINSRALSQFGRRYLVMQTRKRVTRDGGASVLVLGS
ncbi:hypothetical protein FPV67DRAFT_1558760 [Lyophyllum atratum]|nr:hypothetical protein FPV67DRAFT_1558760 [Lyophyllum atratum]